MNIPVRGIYNIYAMTSKRQYTIRKVEEKRKIINHLSRIEGQIKGVKKMVEDDKYCNDILIQLAAIDKSIKSLSRTVLNRHMQTCVLEQIKDGNEEVISEVIELLKRFDL